MLGTYDWKANETDMHKCFIPFSSGCRSNKSSTAPKNKKRRKN